MNRLVLQGISLSRAECCGLGDGVFDERGVLGRRALPADDPPGEGVDDEGWVGERAACQAHVGEVGDQQPVRCGHPELALDQVRCPGRGRVRGRGADLLGPGRTVPAVRLHEPLNGAARNLDAVAMQLGPHLQRSVERLRLAAAALVEEWLTKRKSDFKLEPTL